MPSVQNFGYCIEFCVDSDGTESVGAYLVKISAFELNPITLADLVFHLPVREPARFFPIIAIASMFL